MIYGNSEIRDILGKIKDDSPLLTEWERGLLATCRSTEPRQMTPKQKDALGKLWDSLPARRKPKEWENL